MNKRLQRILCRARAANDVQTPFHVPRDESSQAIAQRLMAPGGPFCLEERFANRTPALRLVASNPEPEVDFLAAAIRRAFASGVPAAPPRIVAQPRLKQLEQRFLALSHAEREDEIARHVWSQKDPSRPRTVWSDLLESWEIVDENAVSDPAQA